MEHQTNNAKLFAKIALVMAQVRTLEKDGRNTFDKYDYVTSDAIAIRVGKVLAEVGLAFLPSLVSIETSEYTTKNGGSNFRTVAHFQMTLACTETGATFTTLWSGEAIDRSDKSISKAAVSAVKYYLLKTFLLAGGDEEDADAESQTVAGRQNATQPTQKPVAASSGKNEQDNPFNDSTPYYRHAWNRLTGKHHDFVKLIAELDDQSNEPCTVKQYQYLTGIVDALTNKQHNYALSVLCQKDISGDNLPGRKAAAALLKYLPETITQKDANGKAIKGDDDKPIMVSNPEYRRDFCELITDMAKDTVAVTA